MVISIVHLNSHITDRMIQMIRYHLRRHSYTISKTFIYSDIYFTDTFEDIQRMRMMNKDAFIVLVLKKPLGPETVIYEPFHYIFENNLELGVSLMLSLYMSHYDYYQFKYEHNEMSIPIHDIFYIETHDHLSTIHTKKKNYHLYKPLKIILEEIPSTQIVQINKSTCINSHYINKIHHRDIYLGHHIFKLGQVYKNSFYNALKKKSEDF